MRHKIYQYLSVGIGCLISAVAINSFLVPHHLLSGGVSGIAIIIYYLVSWPIGLQMLVMNLPSFMLLIGSLAENIFSKPSMVQYSFPYS